jgi:uncharacterized protein YqjF (DUF2071 family)
MGAATAAGTAAEAALTPLGSVVRSIRCQQATLSETAHRPWPLPDGPWLMGQSWLDLLFAHWPVEPSALERVVPAELPLDLYDGSAWIGITPFRVEGLRLRGTPPLPGVSSFPELNVRTYVTVDGKPGIFFHSLDTSNPLAVAAARRAYRLPYFRAEMRCERESGWIDYSHARTSPQAPPAAFSARYRPTGPAQAADGSLARWLAERYCLYTLDERRRPLRGDIHHPPWPLEEAEAEIDVNTMTAQLGIELGGAPLLHFSARQDTLIWSLRPAL